MYQESNKSSNSQKMSDEEFYEYLNNIQKIFEEIKRRDAEDEKKMKKVAIRSMIISLANILIIVFGTQVVNKMFEEDKEKDKKIINNTSSSDNYLLIKMHKLEKKDTLERLAYEANCTVEEIINLNKDLDVGSTIKIPYNIQEENLEYYLETIAFDNEKIEEIAKKYNTDIETLKNMNSESILEISERVIILGDTIKVPRFITKQELGLEKSASKVYIK